MPEAGALLVPYNDSTAGEVIIGLAGLGPVVFLVPTHRLERVGGILSRAGQVVELTGDLDRDVDLARSHDPRGILTFSETMIRSTADLAAALGLDYHSPSTALLLTDKFHQRERLRATGVDSVRSRLVEDGDQWWPAIRAVGVPAVIKPVQSQGSRSTYPILDDASAAQVGSELFPRNGQAPEPFVVEEMLVGRNELPFGNHVSVECLAQRGRIVPVAVTGKPPLRFPFREQGQFWPSHLAADEQQAVADLAVAALDALGVRTGLSHTEIKLTADGPRIIEVNGRMGGYVNELYRRSCGVDMVRTSARLALGESVVDDVQMRSDRVYFQIVTPGTTRRGQLVAVHGHDLVRKTPGITAYRPLIRAGEQFEGSVGTNPIDLVCGDAADHLAMVAVLDQALAHLEYEYVADGETWRESVSLTADLDASFPNPEGGVSMSRVVCFDD